MPIMPLAAGSHRVHRLLAVLGVSLLSAVACEPTSSTTTQSSRPFIIGQAIALTGFLEPYDGPAATFSEFAVEDINAKGGVLGRKLELISSDTKSDQAAGAQAALDVINRGAKLIIISCDFDFGSAAALTARDVGMIAFSTCGASTHFSTENLGPLTYTMGAPEVLDVTTGAEWAVKQQGWKSAYLLQDTTIEVSQRECTYFPEVFEPLGGKILGKDTFANDDPSIASQISRIRALPEQPDFLFLCSYLPGGASAVRQIRAAGINTPILATTGMDGTLWEKAVPGLSDFYFTSLVSELGDDPNPKVNELTQRYIQEDGSRPVTSLGYTGYSVIEAIALAATRAGSFDPQAMAEELNKFDKEPLLVGPISYDKVNHWSQERQFALKSVTDGKVKFVGYFQPENPPPLLP
jgi:branched-chain amino acid transport system substrate-binding protein